MRKLKKDLAIKINDNMQNKKEKNDEGDNMYTIKTIIKDFKKHDVIIGVAVGLLSVVLFKFSTGIVLLIASALIFAAISAILSEKTRLKPDVMTMVVVYWLLLTIGSFIISMPTTTLSPAIGFLSALMMAAIYSFIVFLLTAFTLFVISILFKLKSSKK